jgi:hypothetical protein
MVTPVTSQEVSFTVSHTMTSDDATTVSHTEVIGERT